MRFDIRDYGLSHWIYVGRERRRGGGRRGAGMTAGFRIPEFSNIRGSPVPVFHQNTKRLLLYGVSLSTHYIQLLLLLLLTLLLLLLLLLPLQLSLLLLLLLLGCSCNMSALRPPALRYAFQSTTLLYLRGIQRRHAQVHDVRFLVTHRQPQKVIEEKYKEKLHQKARE